MKSWSPEEIILLSWAQPCQGPKPETHEKMASSSNTHIQMGGAEILKPGVQADGMCRKCPPQYFPLDICGLKTALLYRLIQPIYLSLFPWSCPTPKPWLLIEMYLITQPLCSIIYYKYTGLPGNCSSFIGEPMPTGPRFSTSLSFFIPSQPRIGQVPWDMQGGVILWTANRCCGFAPNFTHRAVNVI